MTAKEKARELVGEILEDWIFDRAFYEQESDAPLASTHGAPVPYFISDFGCVPEGAFPQPNKFKAYPSPAITSLYDADINGDFFKLVSGGGPNGEQCQEHSYGQGSYGMGTQYYQLKLGACCAGGQPINAEWDWKFLPGADILDDASGKIAPAIQVGKISGADAGTRMMTWFSAQGSNAKAPKFTANMQDQRSGSQWVPGGQNYSPFNIALDVWYHFRMQWLPGPDGFAKWWLNREPWKECGPTPNNLLDDSVMIDVTTFYGGGAANSPKNSTSKSRLANLEVYSGETNPGPGPMPPEPSPAPDDGFTVTINGVRYRVTGEATLTTAAAEVARVDMRKLR
jgi:hypothetical protein